MEKTVWTAIARFLSGRSLVMLALTSKWFYRLIMDESIWKFACLRDLRVPEPKQVSFKWISLYASAFDGSHSYRFRQQEKHFGAPDREFESHGNTRSRDYGDYIGVRRLVLAEEHQNGNLDSWYSLVICIYFAVLSVTSAVVQDSKIFAVVGSMLKLEARYIELFLNEGYQDGTWEYQGVGAHDIKENTEAASGAILDVKHLKDSSTSAFDVKSWVVEPANRITKDMAMVLAVALYTDLEKVQGWHLKYHVMRAGADGEVVSIRIGLRIL